MMMMNPDEELRQKLRAWQPQPELPVRFQAGVWARLGARSAARSLSWVEQLSYWLETALAQPRYAAAVIVAAATLGLGLAGISAHATRAERALALEARYVRSVDPYFYLASTRP